MHQLTSQSHHRGFTIMELLVAIGIASLLMFMVSQLFINTSRAVQVGVRTGDMLVESEVIADHLQRDVERMSGPNSISGSFGAEPPGVLVIVNKLYDDAEVTLDNRVLPDQAVRSDQLAFIAHDPNTTNSLQALAPQSDSVFYNENRANHARVWYGHLLRTQPDGDTPTSAHLPDTDRANGWMLGRQQLLLMDDPIAGASSSDSLYGSNVSGITYPHGPANLFHGLTDVADQPLHSDPASLIDQLDATTNGYGDRALGLTFYRDAGERLHANPAPSNASGYMTSAQIAQMHTILAMGVSDFIVEFAGDYDGSSTGEIDRDPEGYIKWYGYYFNNPHDPGESNYARDDGGNLAYDPALPRSYDATQLSSVFQLLDGGTAETPHFQHENSSPVFSTDNADAVFVFRHDDDDSANSKWPYLIRIRYRMHDPRGMVQNSIGQGGAQAGRWFEHIMRVPRP